MDALAEQLGRLAERLRTIEAKLDQLVRQRAAKEWYTTARPPRSSARPSSPCASGAAWAASTPRSGPAAGASSKAG